MPEAVQLSDLLQIWAQPWCKIYTFSSGFLRASKRSLDAARTTALFLDVRT